MSLHPVLMSSPVSPNPVSLSEVHHSSSSSSFHSFSSSLPGLSPFSSLPVFYSLRDLSKCTWSAFICQSRKLLVLNSFDVIIFLMILLQQDKKRRAQGEKCHAASSFFLRAFLFSLFSKKFLVVGPFRCLLAWRKSWRITMVWCKRFNSRNAF
jgi:hypothetical protein